MTDFPVLLRESDLPAGMLDAASPVPAQTDGGDIRITADRAGTELLGTEIFVWDQAAGDAVIWTRLPSLAQDSDTTLWIWWGGDGTQTGSSATVIDNVLGAGARPQQAWAGHFDYLRRDPRDVAAAVSVAPALLVDIKRLEVTQGDGTPMALTSLPGFSYIRAGRTTVYRDGETRIVDTNEIPVGDLGYASQPATTQLLGINPLDLTTATDVSTTIADLGPFQIFRRVSVVSVGSGTPRQTATLSATAGQPFSVQWYFQAGSSGQAFLEVLNLDSLGFGLIRGPIGNLAITREDAAFGAFSDFRVERLSGGVWRVLATVTPAETATYRIGIGPNASAPGEDIIALAMSAQDESAPTALIPDGSRNADNMQLTGLSDLGAGTLAVAAAPETVQVSGFAQAAVLSDSTFNEQIQIGFFQNPGRFVSQTRAGGAFVGGVSGEGLWQGHEISVRSWSDGVNLWADSAAGEGSGSMPAPAGMTTLSIGANLGDSHFLGGIAWIALWKTALDLADIRRLRVPGRKLASLGLQGGQTVGVSIDGLAPASLAQSGLEIEYWTSDGERIAASAVSGDPGTSGRLSAALMVPGGAAWIRYRVFDTDGLANRFLAQDGILRRSGDTSPPAPRSSDWIETRQNNESLDGFAASGATTSLATVRIGATVPAPGIQIAGTLRVLARAANVTLGEPRVAAAGTLRVSGGAWMTMRGAALTARGQGFFRSIARRIRAGDDSPAHTTVHGTRTHRVYVTDPDN